MFYPHPGSKVRLLKLIWIFQMTCDIGLPGLKIWARSCLRMISCSCHYFMSDLSLSWVELSAWTWSRLIKWLFRTLSLPAHNLFWHCHWQQHPFLVKKIKVVLILHLVKHFKSETSRHRQLQFVRFNEIENCWDRHMQTYSLDLMKSILIKDFNFSNSASFYCSLKKRLSTIKTWCWPTWSILDTYLV